MSVLVEVTRGGRVESRHAGAFAVVDAEGALVLSEGDIDRPVFPRSAVKLIQALPLVESGAADRFGLDDESLALACASHNGEERHAEVAARGLARLGLDEAALECGAHWPSLPAASQRLARQGASPSALHNNCSGKHTGFLCLACGLGAEPRGYIQPEHAVQRSVKSALEEVTGFALAEGSHGIDGCSIPTYAIPLRALALGFARLGSGHGVSLARAQAAARLRRAVARHPFMVGGTGRFDTVVMEALGERAFTKTGAEGVFCAALPELGLGVALKCEDGAGRAAEVVMAALLLRLLPLSEAERAVVAPFAAPVLRNWNGIEVGRLRATLPV
ncbi:asparaginase [Pseudoroseomonas cervicalis]|uniref:L-asparaginase, thermolabile n=1 Tax=Pseudoroseomonas cervicalis ATCC 49957 TaxID=525371 RepID=D5RK29_9PROT|nr:asparaginase [Pseudoroseomonas cervicalis]EFH12338.1 L-asparaginase, thermolabile [Pseudoroseomonas cervicalis ATCC 49957]